MKIITKEELINEIEADISNGRKNVVCKKDIRKWMSRINRAQKKFLDKGDSIPISKTLISRKGYLGESEEPLSPRVITSYDYFKNLKRTIKAWGPTPEIEEKIKTDAKKDELTPGELAQAFHLIIRRKPLGKRAGRLNYVQALLLKKLFMKYPDHKKLAERLDYLEQADFLKNYIGNRSGKLATDAQINRIDHISSDSWPDLIDDIGPWQGISGSSEQKKLRDEHYKKTGQWLEARRFKGTKINRNCTSGGGTEFNTVVKEEHLIEMRRKGIFKPELWLYPAVLNYPKSYSIVSGIITEQFEKEIK